MLMYIIGPWTFQMICLGLILETLGIKYEPLLQDEQRQEAA